MQSAAPSKADTIHYLDPILDLMGRKWPDNRTVNIVFHGHSVPSGYFATPYVNTFEAYPARLHQSLKERFPFAVINIIITAIGGENSQSGAARFTGDVLCHKPDIVVIDYALNDRGIGLEKAEASWKAMIEAALAKDIKVLLMTPTWDQSYFEQDENWKSLEAHAEQVRNLAAHYHVGLADSFESYRQHVHRKEDLV
ncbi:MAG: SGNH/GDSL hydrolase family protein, partial [Treponema sp.]|nr:SGNH/GDSL hydrolase family protein [Treponema sp.]